jgi:hypothetical protein
MIDIILAVGLLGAFMLQEEEGALPLLSLG